VRPQGDGGAEARLLRDALDREVGLLEEALGEEQALVEDPAVRRRAGDLAEAAGERSR
jgi:hypothetical protein